MKVVIAVFILVQLCTTAKCSVMNEGTTENLLAYRIGVYIKGNL